MNSSLLFFVLLCLTLFSYWFGVQRSLKAAGGVEHKKNLTSLPEQFGLLTAMVCGLPALMTLLIFNSAEQFVIEQLLTTTLPTKIQSLSNINLGLYLNTTEATRVDPARSARSVGCGLGGDGAPPPHADESACDA